MKSLSKYCLDLKANNKKALVVYITAGIQNWKEAISRCIANGADIIEVGLPFSDPTMDGPIIAQASYKSIQDGNTTLGLLKELSEQNYDKPLVVMTYINVLYSHGLDNSIRALEEANVKGLILPDLSFEESELVSREISEKDIAQIQLLSSTTNSQRAEKIKNTSQGFLYTIALKGITGQEVSFDKETIEFFNRNKSDSRAPSYCGIGIKTSAQAKEIAQYCDGIIVGSSIVKMLMDDPQDLNALGNFVKELKNAIS